MLKAIRYSKTRFVPNEDTLTSSIFQLLTYLPQELLWKIIGHCIGQKRILPRFNELEKIEFWPHWQKDKRNGFVEPDVFLSFRNLDIIVEVKWGNNKQDKDQWKRELKAYLKEFGRTKRVLLLAIGGIKNNEDELLNIRKESYEILKCRWLDLLNTIYFFKSNIDFEQNYNLQIARIIDDLILSFEMHGFFVGFQFDKEVNFRKLKTNFDYKKINQWKPII